MSGVPSLIRSSWILVRLISRPRPTLSPSSSDSFIVGAIRSSLALAALILLPAFVSASFSFRFRSLLKTLRSSFSIRSAHQPANESQRWDKTFSMTRSILTPALRIRCKVSFSSGDVKGAGVWSLRMACCPGACSDNHGCVSISPSDGLWSGRLDNRDVTRSLAGCGIVSGYFGSSFSIRIFVSFSSSSSNGSSPQRRAYRIIPKLQTSTFSPAYFSPLSISGAL